MRHPLSVLLVAILVTGCRHIPELPTARSATPGSPGSLALVWHGTSTLTLDDGSHGIMVDGFFSRPGKARLLLGWAGLPVVDSNQRRLRLAESSLKGQPVHAILVAHAHHDHALDAAHIARYTKAPVYGSRSSMQVVTSARTAGDGPVAMNVVGHKDTVCVGRFRITVLDTPHKPTTFGPNGEIDQPLHRPAALRDFRAGPSHAYYIEHPNGHVLIVPSPIHDLDFRLETPSQADVVLLGLGTIGRDSDATIKAYWRAAVHPDRTTRVHPIHWDDFTVPISTRPPAFPFSKAAHAARIMTGLAGGKEFSLLPAGKSVRLPIYPRSSRGCPPAA